MNESAQSAEPAPSLVRLQLRQGEGGPEVLLDGKRMPLVQELQLTMTAEMPAPVVMLAFLPGAVDVDLPVALRKPWLPFGALGKPLIPDESLDEVLDRLVDGGFGRVGPAGGSLVPLADIDSLGLSPEEKAKLLAHQGSILEGLRSPAGCSPPAGGSLPELKPLPALDKGEEDRLVAAWRERFGETNPESIAQVADALKEGARRRREQEPFLRSREQEPVLRLDLTWEDGVEQHTIRRRELAALSPDGLLFEEMRGRTGLQTVRVVLSCDAGELPVLLKSLQVLAECRNP